MVEFKTGKLVETGGEGNRPKERNGSQTAEEPVSPAHSTRRSRSVFSSRGRRRSAHPLRFLLVLVLMAGTLLVGAPRANADISCIHGDDHSHYAGFYNGIHYKYRYEYRWHGSMYGGHYHEYYRYLYKSYDGQNWWGREFQGTNGRWC